ncbi:MAG: hypothetical protein ACOCZB_09215 [Spirochaetota bacterium]
MRAGRRSIVTIVLLLAVAVAVSGQTTEFSVVNRTGAAVYFLYASPSSADSWGEDLLGRSVLPHEGVLRVRLRSGAARYDVRAVDANDNEYIIWRWAPDDGGRLVLTNEAFVGSRANVASAAASASALSWITLVNDTGYDVAQVHVAPAGAAGWDEGEQILEAGEIFHFGEDYRIDLDTERYGTYVYDMMLVDVDGDRYVKRDINLELTTEVVYTLDDLEWQ